MDKLIFLDTQNRNDLFNSLLKNQKMPEKNAHYNVANNINEMSLMNEKINISTEH
jgi:hypothetical protein